MMVIRTADLLTFTGEALAVKYEVVDKRKTVNVADRTKKLGST